MNNINELIREAKDNAREANRRLNEYADGIHTASTDGIDTNAGGVADLAEIISSYEERISALEKEVENLEGDKSK